MTGRKELILNIAVPCRVMIIINWSLSFLCAYSTKRPIIKHEHRLKWNKHTKTKYQKNGNLYNFNSDYSIHAILPTMVWWWGGRTIPAHKNTNTHTLINFEQNCILIIKKYSYNSDIPSRNSKTRSFQKGTEFSAMVNLNKEDCIKVITSLM